MERDFYIDELEVAVASNIAFGLLNYLAATLDTYSKIMNQVITESIRDDEITKEINDIITLTESYSEEIVEFADKLLNNIVSPELMAVEENNKFDFPDEPNLNAIPVIDAYGLGGF